MEDKILNEKESLELISQMIQNTQQKLKAGNGLAFLIFGYTTAAISVLVYLFLKETHNSWYNLMWLGIPIIGYVLLYFFSKKEVKLRKTYVDRIIGNVWTIIGLAVFFISVSAGFVRIPILPILILLLGIGTTLTGTIIRYKPVIICGALGMVSCVLPFLINGYDQNLIYGFCIFVMMVIPGHILNYQGRTQNV